MDGVLLVNKPAGMTSHDCVFKVRKLFKTRKVGHTGTLDPDVTGVLPICLGRATKIVEYLTASSKTYEAEVTLGFSTTTEDASGEVVEKAKVISKPEEKTIDEILASFEGVIEQTPPMYSAVKINGKKLYEYARKGIEIERPSREIKIHSMERISEIEMRGEEAAFKFRVNCSKGTYVRTLAVMIGEKLGIPAHMSHLVRTSSGSFSLENCLSFEEIEQKLAEDSLQLITIAEALNHLPKWEINDTLAEKVKNGAVLPVPEEFQELGLDARVAVYNEQGECLAIYQKHPAKPSFKPSKVLSMD
ncbi:tRNA pseudouridine(55) synthase TruB [Bacillus sp. FJAT-42376]|uniref:tRNA pseudouridine(55) synthase TruB n=1 Tax=Bacillus sp. FJAT-42376 TaxID=2014076 RepID=UPI000F5144C2|nr:tRNA pseudouridine(55) synthase TruB [Bacillus sp. FJAT-42376]AZB42982.1 tRNA pseudouridine(55) synthase TruB [Bacillus sp. FJAT-42376]